MRGCGSAGRVQPRRGGAGANGRWWRRIRESYRDGGRARSGVSAGGADRGAPARDGARAAMPVLGRDRGMVRRRVRRCRGDVPATRRARGVARHPRSGDAVGEGIDPEPSDRCADGGASLWAGAGRLAHFRDRRASGGPGRLVFTSPDGNWPGWKRHGLRLRWGIRCCTPIYGRTTCCGARTVWWWRLIGRGPAAARPGSTSSLSRRRSAPRVSIRILFSPPIR